MTFSEVLKHNGLYSSLLREAENPVHSYMIVSKDTLTTDLCADTLISSLAKIAENEVNFSKDVYSLPFGEKVLSDDADFITETAYLMPAHLNKKYFVVHKAETTNEAAQNKLLKTLEEAPNTSVIILLCANEFSMLPTVRSRCRILRPTGYSNEVLREIIGEEFPSCLNPSFIIAMSDGRLDRLKEIAEDGTKEFDFVLKMLTCMRKSNEILPFASELILNKEKLGEILDITELILRDCMVIRDRPTLINLKENVADIKELSCIFTPEVVIREMSAISRAKRRISAGGNVNSIIDELLFSLLEEKAKCQK